MIFIVTALMIEAAPIIEYFKLKKDLSLPAYAVFKNDDMALVVSGVGKIQSAMAAIYLMTAFGPAKEDILVNIGFCGANTRTFELGTLLAVNKVTDRDTGRDYYPDLLVGRDLPQAALNCCSRPMRAEQLQEDEKTYCDMESAGIMEAAKKFIYAHHILILKIISDYMMPENLDATVLKGYIRDRLPLIAQKLHEVRQLSENYAELPLDAEKRALHQLSEDFQFSKSMEQILLKETIKAKQRGLEPLTIFESQPKPAMMSKKEGKRFFEQLIEKLRQ